MGQKEQKGRRSGDFEEGEPQLQAAAGFGLEQRNP